MEGIVLIEEIELYSDGIMFRYTSKTTNWMTNEFVPWVDFFALLSAGGGVGILVILVCYIVFLLIQSI